MITIEGQQMGKSLGNFITLDEFFTGRHKALTQAYSPMTIRFFILQAHYRSTLDFSNEALQAAEKGLKKLMSGYETLCKLAPVGSQESGVGSRESAVSSQQSPVTSHQSPVTSIQHLYTNCYAAMNDDFNSPVVIANLFEGVRIINSVYDKKETLSSEDLSLLKDIFTTFMFDILGLKEETGKQDDSLVEGLMQTILSLRERARLNKDWPASDTIRTDLEKLNIIVKDTKDGAKWSIE